MDLVVGLIMAMVISWIVLIGCFVLGILFERKLGDRHVKMPAVMLKARTADKLHQEGCWHLNRCTADSIEKLLICKDCCKIMGACKED